MVSVMKNLLVLAIIASVATSAFALQCYRCDSASNAKCGEKFEAQDQFKLDCPNSSQIPLVGNILNFNATGCMKRVIEHPGNPSVIERSCYYGDISKTEEGCNTISSLFTTGQKRLSCAVCRDNLCNGSSALAPIGFALMLFFALARLFA